MFVVSFVLKLERSNSSISEHESNKLFISVTLDVTNFGIFTYFNFEQFCDLIKMTDINIEENKNNRETNEEQKEAEYDSVKNNLYMQELNNTIDAKKRNKENYVLTQNDDEDTTSETTETFRMSLLTEQSSGRKYTLI